MFPLQENLCGEHTFCKLRSIHCRRPGRVRRFFGIILLRLNSGMRWTCTLTLFARYPLLNAGVNMPRTSLEAVNACDSPPTLKTAP